MDASNVLFLEPGATEWGPVINPEDLGLSELRLHLQARGHHNTSGTRGELVLVLQQVLEDEALVLWQQRQEALSKKNKRLKALVRALQEEDEDFDLSVANKWKKEYEEAGAWQWSLDPRSLHAREVHARKAYAIAARARARKLAGQGRAEDEEEAKRREAEEALQAKQRNMAQKRAEVKADSCLFRTRVDGVDYHCVNTSLSFEDGTRLRTCGFHAAACTDTDYHRAIGGPEAKPPRIKMPNEFGVCSDCFKRRTGRQPPALLRHQCPGTHELRADVLAKIAQIQDLMSAPRHGDERLRPCAWRAAVPGEEKAKLVCKNLVLRQGRSTCGYHSMRCELKHPGKAPKIRFPNALGMCKQHYAGKTGRDACAEMAAWATIRGKRYPPGVVLVHKKVKELVPHTLLPGRRPLGPVVKAARRQLAPVDDEDWDKPIRVIDIDWARIDPRPRLKKAVVAAVARRVPDTVQHKMVMRKRSLQRSLLGGRYATELQRIWRGHLARRRARSVRNAWRARLRWHAAVAIQALVRSVQARKAVRVYEEQMRKAVRLFQQHIRGYLTRKHGKIERAARSIQRVCRGFLCRLDLRAYAIIDGYRHARANESWAQFVLVRYLKRYIKRWRVHKAARVRQLREEAATLLQAMVRGFTARRRQKRRRFMRRKTVGAAKKIQGSMRRFLVERRLKQQCVENHAAAIFIQKCWRGFRCRVRAYLEREAIEKAWRWFSPQRPRTAFAHLLPREYYGAPLLSHGGVQFWMDPERVRVADLLHGMKLGPPKHGAGVGTVERGNNDAGAKQPQSSPSAGQDSDRAGLTQEEVQEEDKRGLWSQVPFLAFDPMGTGKVRRFEFGAALRGMEYRLSDEQISALVRTWSTTDGMVDYMGFLGYARREVAACEKHRAWACPLCIRPGPCAKCSCKCFAKSGASVTQRSVCECGHYVAMHSMIPKARSGRTPGSREPLTRTELQRMLRPPSRVHMSSAVSGSALPATKLVMHFEQQDLRVRAQTAAPADRQARRTMVRVAHAGNLSALAASKAFLRLGERIIHDITKESKEIVAELRRPPGWNDSTCPLETYPGTRPALHSHQVPEVGDIQRLEAPTARPGTRQRPGTSQALTSLLPAADDVIVDDVERLEEQRALHAEKCLPQKLGRLILESAARPHTCTHQIRPGTSTGGAETGPRFAPAKKAVAPRYVARLLRAQESRAEYRRRATKRRCSTPAQFAKGFDVSDPVPLIVSDTLRMEAQTTELYVDMLLALSSEECGLLEDWPALVAYVFQSFAFIDRHWRKLVHDIRTGTLDQNLPVDATTRKLVCEALRPNPARATMFDQAMRRLGFYKGQAAASLLPEAPDEPGTAESEVEGGGHAPASARDMQDLAARAARERQEARAAAARRASCNVPGPRAATALPAVRSLELPANERELRKRVEAVQPSDVVEMRCQPRVGPGRVSESASRRFRRFVCAFPGCGRAFSTRTAAESHSESVHSGRLRLAHEADAADERMHMYWPSCAPWVPDGDRNDRNKHGIRELVSSEEAARAKAKAERLAFPYACTRPGCAARFRTAKERTAHAQAVHERLEELAALVGHVKDAEGVRTGRETFHCPPTALPAGLSITCCSKHWVALTVRCDECRRIVSGGHPIAPLTFVDHARLHSELTVSAHSRTVVHVAKGSGASFEEHLGRIIGVFRDKFGRPFVAYTRFYRGHEQATPSNNEQQVTEKPHRTLVTRLENVAGVSIVLRCSKSEYERRVRDETLPQLPQLMGPLAAMQRKLRRGVFFCPEDDRLLETKEHGRFLPLVKRVRGLRLD